LIKEFKATVLICTSSYALHLGEIAQTMGVNFGKDTNIRLVIVTGEPPLPNARTLIKEIWKAEKRDRLGCAEAGGIAFECPFCPGIYHIQERYVIPEVKVEFNSSWMGF
jgi:phenylacetate-CoA ligase